MHLNMLFWRYIIPSSSCLLQGDLAAGEMIHGVEGVDPTRRQQLIDLLDIDLQWRLNRVSDGQRRRVQICMGLLKPYKVCKAPYPTPSLIPHPPVIGAKWPFLPGLFCAFLYCIVC